MRRRFPLLAMLPQGVAGWIQWSLRLLLGGAFLTAGLLKMADPIRFARDVENYRLLPHALLHAVAILLPAVEVLTGGLVLLGLWLRASATILVGLTGLFLLVICSALIRGLNIECGCFGTVGGRHVGWVNLAVDGGLFILAVLLTRTTGGREWPAISFDEIDPLEVEPTRKMPGGDGAQRVR